ncbi:MAG: tetratricopeptide repeat protein [Pseudomonadota bacterium]|nr:tetratricopeptide repeat protein [Pseudomonadota bacterium]
MGADDPALLERIEGLEEIVADDPEDFTARFMLATELAKAGRHAQAIPHFQQVIDADADYTAAYRGLGRALVAEGDTDGARGVFERGLVVADRTGDYQSGKEMEVFLRRYTTGE